MENYDIGAQEDFDNMTYELGHEILIYPRPVTLDYDSSESISGTNIFGSTRGIGFPIHFSSSQQTREYAFLQELNSEHEAVQNGVFVVGDVKVTFQANSTVQEESIIIDNNKKYKILKLTKVEGMNNSQVLFIKAYGKKISGR